jgi:hypothetical protein
MKHSLYMKKFSFCFKLIIVLDTVAMYDFHRYALKDLWESEREYVRDLTTVMESYFKALEGQVPAELAGKRDVIFTTFPEISSFHNELVVS